MPDNEHNERNLEGELRELGKNIEYPPTPDLSQAVRSRIEAERNSGGIWSRLPSARWAAAAAVVVVMASPFLSPAFRDAASDFFVFGQASREAGRAAPESAGGGDLPESASPAGSAEEEAPTSGEAAEGIPPGEANSRLDGLLLIPGLGEPDEIYAIGQGGVMLVYNAPGLTFTQRPGEVETAFPASRRPGIEDAAVNGGRGYWRPSGILFWERDGIALRLQSGLAKEEAIRLAESAR